MAKIILGGWEKASITAPRLVHLIPVEPLGAHEKEIKRMYLLNLVPLFIRSSRGKRLPVNSCLHAVSRCTQDQAGRGRSDFEGAVYRILRIEKISSSGHARGGANRNKTVVIDFSPRFYLFVAERTCLNGPSLLREADR